MLCGVWKQNNNAVWKVSADPAQNMYVDQLGELKHQSWASNVVLLN